MLATGQMRTLLLGVVCAIGCGCSKQSAPLPGVTFSLSAIIRTKDSKLDQQTPTRVEGALVEDVEDVTFGSDTLSVLVRKTQYGRATFGITFPDHSTQTIQVKSGEIKDVLPKGKKLGVRIEVHDAH
jgi:hypothetical protein